MNLYICDRCGKQIDRFVNKDMPKYTLHNGIDIRVSEDAGKAMWQRPLTFCNDCEKIMSNLIEANLHVPTKVTLSTDPKWGNLWALKKMEK